MFRDLPLFPEEASSIAGKVDAVFLAALGVAVVFSLLIAVLIIYFSIRYRRRHAGEVGRPEKSANWLEITWSIVPLLIMLFLFGWGAKVYFSIYRPPADSQQYYVTGKQWMWKFQHPEGHREINELHVPVGRPIELILTSEDVIHSLYIPAFRIKRDAVPGRYTTAWFEATKTGEFHIFCAEYCGAEHSLMRGRVVVMEPHEYDLWLQGNKPETNLLTSGRALFEAKTCNTCHRTDSNARAPYLEGLFGKTVVLQGGGTVVADDQYLRESMMNPGAKIVAGYQPIMPTFKGQLSEDEIRELIQYIKSLGTKAADEESSTSAEPRG